MGPAGRQEGRALPGSAREERPIAGTIRARRRILLICGSLNQTTIMHQVGGQLAHHECRYTPFYADGLLAGAERLGWLDFTIIGAGGRHRGLTDEYLRDQHLPLDPGGRSGRYDLVLTCSDLLVQRNIRRTPTVLVQEGMTDPVGLSFHLVRWLGLPRWLASTATTGLSRAYLKFCVASNGYRDLFVSHGVPADRIVVTGIPNFDNCRAFLDNDFPYRDYVLVATSDTRETFKRDNRRRFLQEVAARARGRPLLFKLHPNEDPMRSEAEIRARFPEASVFTSGNTNHMIANCQALITQYSSVVHVGLALGKECYSCFDLAELGRLLPEQNGGRSAARIARVCENVLAGERPPVELRPLLVGVP